MFSGIIEELGHIVGIEKDENNVHFQIEAKFNHELKVDQSIAHNGVCLTVVKLDPETNCYTVTAIKETLEKSNLRNLHIGSHVNLERCITPETRIDGHYVQGHVDTTSECLTVREVGGSWYYTFQLPSAYKSLIVDKGSIAINGVSLTVVDPTEDTFQVAIIPFTYKRTVFQYIKEGSRVNLEFDILGKYVARHMKYYRSED